MDIVEHSKILCIATKYYKGKLCKNWTKWPPPKPRVKFPSAQITASAAILTDNKGFASNNGKR